MGALAVAEPILAPSLGPEAGGERTLDELIVGAWEELTARRVAPCVVCGGEMVRVPRRLGEPVRGVCRDCGTEMS